MFRGATKFHIKLENRVLRTRNGKRIKLDNACDLHGQHLKNQPNYLYPRRANENLEDDH